MYSLNSIGLGSVVKAVNYSEQAKPTSIAYRERSSLLILAVE